MKIAKNHEAFRTFNQKLKNYLKEHPTLQVLAGQALYDAAESITTNLVDSMIELRMNSDVFECIAGSVQLSDLEIYILEQNGKIYYRDVTHYVLKELSYRVLTKYVKERQKEAITMTV